MKEEEEGLCCGAHLGCGIEDVRRRTVGLASPKFKTVLNGLLRAG